jgi:hypothetical protein
MSVLSNHYPEVLDQYNADPRDQSRPADDDAEYLEFMAFVGQLQDEEERIRWSDPLYLAEMEREATIVEGETL